MDTRFITAGDGTRIAYDVQGTGPALILLHGGEQNRHYWHNLGYVPRLTPEFTVITIDIRGNGESDKPEDPACYAHDRHILDVLAVADACAVDQFALWGFSYGGYIGRYLAAHGDRVQAFVMIGIAFGLGASGDFRTRVEQLRAYWAPIVRAHHEGTLDLASLSEADQAEYQRNTIPLTVAWLGAMLRWPTIEPHDLQCSTLWLVGSENPPAMASVQAYHAMLPTSSVQTQIVDGLNHRQELTEIDTVLPIMRAFTQME